ncbi:MAG: hypothetical protein ACLFUO_00115 [Candidatus Woesearchaeota archaeon]
MMLVIPFSSALDIFIEFDSDMNVEKYYAFSWNEFYSREFYKGDSLNTGIPVLLYDDSKELISSEKIDDSGRVVFHVDESSSDIYYFRTGYGFSGDYRLINLCDNDGICEPCSDSGCSLSESFASCDDCDSGESDNYCDLEDDGICDPDCEEKDIDCGCDEDCISLLEEDDLISCNSLGGKPCTIYQECDGENIYSDDFGTKCCIGRCVSEENDNDAILLEEAEERDNPENKEDAEKIAYKRSYHYEEVDYGPDYSDFALIFLFILSVALLFVSGSYMFSKQSRKIFDDPVIRYVDGLFRQGYTKDQISGYMMQLGYTRENIQKIFRLLKK